VDRVPGLCLVMGFRLTTMNFNTVFLGAQPGQPNLMSPGKGAYCNDALDFMGFSLFENSFPQSGFSGFSDLKAVNTGLLQELDSVNNSALTGVSGNGTSLNLPQSSTGHENEKRGGVFSGTISQFG
jgi:hypothetical protein